MKIIISTIDITVHKHTCLVAFEYSITKLLDIDVAVLI